MRTLEMVVAIIVTFLFVIYIIPVTDPNDSGRRKKIILEPLQYNPVFIDCVLSEDEICVSNMVFSVLPRTFQYRVLLTNDPLDSLSDLPSKEIYIDTLYVSGEKDIIVKVFYWLP